MELKSCTYATVTTLGDFGPWISKVVLDLPCTVRANDIDARTFHIYVERHERTGEILGRHRAFPLIDHFHIAAQGDGGEHPFRAIAPETAQNVFKLLRTRRCAKIQIMRFTMQQQVSNGTSHQRQFIAFRGEHTP